jgi:glycopeptide antibiotics resistance protein
MANQFQSIGKKKVLLNTLIKGVMIVYIIILLFTLFASINASPGMNTSPANTGYGRYLRDVPVYMAQHIDQ